MKCYNRNGKLYIRLNGTRKSTGLDYTPTNIKFVQNQYKANEFFNKFDISVSDKSFIDYCELVIEEKEKRLKPNSIKAYRSVLSTHIIPFFNKKYPQEITPKVIKDFYSTFTDREQLNTCVSGVMRKAFELAIIDEVIEKTPLIVSFPTLTSDYEINPFNLEEINLILSQATGYFRNFLGVAFFTGLRTGELLALEWKDVNIEDGIIEINKTKSNGNLGTTKTRSSERTIDILSQAEIFLNEQRKLSGLSKYVFPSQKTGKSLYGASSLNYLWKKLLRKCELKERSIYQTRHTFASNMLSNKEDLIWVSQMLGHKSISITTDNYTKYIRPDRERKKTFLDDKNIDFSTKTAQ